MSNLKGLYKGIFLSAVLGVIASAYLLFHHFKIHSATPEQRTRSFCSLNSTFDCDKVALSPYSEFLGVPVAAFGLFYFLFWLLILNDRKQQRDEIATWSLFRAVSILGLLPVIALASISIAEIRAICIVCFTTYILTLIIGALSFRAVIPGASLKSGLRTLAGYFLPIAAEGHTFRFGFVLNTLLLAVLALFLPAVILPGIKPLSTETAELPEALELRYFFERIPRPEAMQIVSEGEDRDFYLGDPSASTIVSVYSDFSCPACRLLAPSLEKLATEYPIKLVYKNFPLDSACNSLIKTKFHEFSCKAATVARCAGVHDPNLFWKAHDLLFAFPEMNEAALKSVVEKLSPETIELEQCVESGTQLTAIKRNIEEGIELQLQGTPSVFIDGRKLNIANEKMLREILKRKK